MSGEWYEVELLQTDGSWKPLAAFEPGGTLSHIAATVVKS